MKVSQFLLTTSKEVPADAQVISHQLMLRAGLIKKLASGLYTWLPLGLRVLRQVEAIIRDEMNKAGCLEVLMPAIQPAELWHETGRWDQFGPQLLKVQDRHSREFCYGPTHEEVITDIVRHELNSYKQTPVTLYQIQSKFRDEIRPRFGVMRAREFIMKDAYSFDISFEAASKTYQHMYDTYTSIFTRLGLNFRAVLADTGTIGGSKSHEFHVLAESGEDQIFYSDESDYAANRELAASAEPSESRPAPTQALEKVSTPGARTIEEVSAYLHVEPQNTIKSLIVHGVETPFVMLLLRGDHELNDLKATKHHNVQEPLTMATDEELASLDGCAPGYFGPVGTSIPVIADRETKVMADFVCGANETDFHYTGANWERDLPEPEFFDLRNVNVGDASPDGQGTLQMCRGIEVGHVFQLGTKYSEAMNATVLDQNGKATALEMGCYGIGVSRIVAASIEQNNDERGVIWPDAIAPFHVAIVPINLHKSQRLQQAADALLLKLQEFGFKVLLDDRKERAGVMFADMDLIGIPHRLVISERGLDEGTIEYKHRRDTDSENIAMTDVVSMLQAKIKL